MGRRPMSAALRGGLFVVALGGLSLTGCASGDTPAPTAPPTADGAADPVVQGTAVPAGWPVGLDLPSGATLLYSTVDTTGMALLFDAPQDLDGLEVFFDRTITGMGFQPESDSGFVDMLSRSWTDGSSVISVTATPIDGRSSGILIVRPTV
ncbi:MAG: hypothetical protein ABJA16_02085 [Nakamurella sp.]